MRKFIAAVVLALTITTASVVDSPATPPPPTAEAHGSSFVVRRMSPYYNTRTRRRLCTVRTPERKTIFLPFDSACSYVWSGQARYRRVYRNFNNAWRSCSRYHAHARRWDGTAGTYRPSC